MNRFIYQENQYWGECLPCTAPIFNAIVRNPMVERKIATRQAIEQAIDNALSLDTWLNDAEFRKFCQQQEDKPRKGTDFAELTDEKKLLQWANSLKQSLPCFVFGVQEFEAVPKTDKNGNVMLDDAGNPVLHRRRLQPNIKRLSGLFMFDADHLPMPPREIYERTQKPNFPWEVRLAHATSSGHGLRLVCEARTEIGNISDNQIELARELQLLGMLGTTGKPVTDNSCIDASRISYAPRLSDIYYIDEDRLFNIETQNSMANIDLFNEMFLESYRHEQSDPTDKSHQFDSEIIVNSVETTPSASTSTEAKEQSTSALETNIKDIKAFDYPVVDFINALFPNGAPKGSRHKMAIKLANDLMVICDADAKKVIAFLMQQQWVKDIVAERGQKELDGIMDAAQKLTHKRESENFYNLKPSKEMQRAIELVSGRKFSVLAKEAQLKTTDNLGKQDDILETLERIGCEVEKLFPKYPLLKLLCHRLKRRHYIAALFTGGAFLMTLMTRTWYQSGMEPGRKCRLNSILELIGRSGSGKHIAVNLYKILMEPIEKADQAQIEALNRWNQERDQKSGGEKNKTPRPKGIFRKMPSETSAAAIREAEFNAKETIDGEEWPLHVSQFNSELDDMITQMKKSYMDIEKLFLKGFHNEPDGAYLKTASSMVGEYDVHFNGVYSGTQDALNKQTTTFNFARGLLFRLTVVPMGDSNFEMRKKHKYDEADRERDEQLKQWAYKLDAMKGEIPCESITDALHEWTERRMKDAAEEGNYAIEDLVKRPYWHGINYSLPFIVSRHWDQMIEEGGRWKCPADFKLDKHDISLALTIVNAQYAFQQHFFLNTGELLYDNQQSEQASGRHHQQKSWIGYRQLPSIFTADDVDRCFGYEKKQGSIYSKLKRLQDDGMAQRIRTGEDRGKYRKLM